MSLYNKARIHFINRTTHSHEFKALIAAYGKDRLEKCWRSWKRIRGSKFDIPTGESVEYDDVATQYSDGKPKKKKRRKKKK